MAGGIDLQGCGRLQVGRDAHGVPTRVHGLIDVWRGTLQARGVHFFPSRIQHLIHFAGRQLEAFRDLFFRGPHVKHILGRIVVHLADFVDVVMQCCHGQFMFAQHRVGFVESPGEVIAIVIHGIIRILGSVEAAMLLIAEPDIYPADDVARHLGKEAEAGYLICVNVVLQQFGVVVAHLLKVRHDPALIH